MDEMASASTSGAAETLSPSAKRKRRRKRKKAKEEEEEEEEEMTPGVVYVGHIPHGFYEQEMRSYFSQFGTVTRLRLARSKKTGRSRGYAFVEFACDEVAKIVASTMNNYLMFDKLLKVQLVEPSKVHRSMFRRQMHRAIPLAARLRHAQRQFNQAKTEDQRLKRVERLKKKEQRKRQKLKELGIDFDFPGYCHVADSDSQGPSHIVFSQIE